jgi:hypothetical protein
VRVKDGGAAAVRNLKVTLTFPPYLKFISASQRGRAVTGKVTWQTSLRPGGTSGFGLTARLTRPPAGVARLAVVACATGASGSTTICASDLDALPGASHSGTVTSSRTAARPAAGSLTGYVTAGLIVLTVAALLAFTASRLRTRRPKRWRHRHSG